MPKQIEKRVSWPAFEHIIDSRRKCEQCENYQVDSFAFCGPATCSIWRDLPNCEETDEED